MWIAFALFEELIALNIERAHSIYQKVLALIPHKKFTFAKLWELAAKFLIRRKDLLGARKLLGRAIGLCPKRKLFKIYIDLEMKLREFDRLRILYPKWIAFEPTFIPAWLDFVNLETALGELDRVRGIFDLALNISFSTFNQEGKVDLRHEETNAKNRTKIRPIISTSYPWESLRKSERLWNSYIDFELTNEPSERQPILESLYESYCLKGENPLSDEWSS